LNLLIVSQYFWPEAFRINDLAAELVKRGHSVTVLTGYPNYPAGRIFPEFRAAPRDFDTYAGADIVRVPLTERGSGGLKLLLNYLSFIVTSCTLGPVRLRGRKIDAIFVYEPSPIMIGLPAIVMKWFKRAPIVFWTLDLWPQSLQAVGAVKSPWILGAVDRLVRFIYGRCDRVLAQSRSFVPQLEKQAAAEKIAYFPQWAEELDDPGSVAPASEVEQRPDLFSIVFTGNIGEAQDFPAIVEAADLLRHEPVRWIVVGSGRRLDWLRSEISLRELGSRFELPGQFPIERMPSFLAHADALLVSLRDEPIFGFTIPGKLQTYFAAGRPILGMLNGEGADAIATAEAGLTAPASDAAALTAAVRRMMALPAEERRRMGERGRAYCAREFDRDTLISRLERMFAELGARGA